MKGLYLFMSAVCLMKGLEDDFENICIYYVSINI